MSDCDLSINDGIKSAVIEVDIENANEETLGDGVCDEPQTPVKLEHSEVKLVD
jgi:hypothetical protein